MAKQQKKKAAATAAVRSKSSSKPVGTAPVNIPLESAPASGRPKAELPAAYQRVLGASIEMGRRIAAARIAAGLGQSRAAEEIGLSQPFMADIERGVVLPSWKNIAAIAKLYGVRIADFLPPDQLWEEYDATEYLRLEGLARKRRAKEKAEKAEKAAAAEKAEKAAGAKRSRKKTGKRLA